MRYYAWLYQYDRNTLSAHTGEAIRDLVFFKSRASRDAYVDEVDKADAALAACPDVRRILRNSFGHVQDDWAWPNLHRVIY